MSLVDFFNFIYKEIKRVNSLRFGRSRRGCTAPGQWLRVGQSAFISVNVHIAKQPDIAKTISSISRRFFLLFFLVPSSISILNDIKLTTRSYVPSSVYPNLGNWTPVMCLPPTRGLGRQDGTVSHLCTPYSPSPSHPLGSLHKCFLGVPSMRIPRRRGRCRGDVHQEHVEWLKGFEGLLPLGVGVDCSRRDEE